MRLSKLWSRCGRGRNEAIYYGLKPEERRRRKKRSYENVLCAVQLLCAFMGKRNTSQWPRSQVRTVHTPHTHRAIDFNLLLTEF